MPQTSVFVVVDYFLSSFPNQIIPYFCIEFCLQFKFCFFTFQFFSGAKDNVQELD